MQAAKGEYFGAFISGLGVIPYVGDVAKVTKVSKHYDTIMAAVKSVKGSKQSLWGIDKFTRGFVYEQMLKPKGLFTVHNFPAIDAWVDGLATSIKTMDLGAKSYLKSGNPVFNQLRKYIDDLAKFKGAGHITEEMVSKASKDLVLGVPKGATAKQMEQLEKAIEYAKQVDIKLIINIVE